MDTYPTTQIETMLRVVAALMLVVMSLVLIVVAAVVLFGLDGHAIIPLRPIIQYAIVFGGIGVFAGGALVIWGTKKTL